MVTARCQLRGDDAPHPGTERARHLLALPPTRIPLQKPHALLTPGASVTPGGSRDAAGPGTPQGSGSIPRQREGTLGIAERPSGAARCRPPCLINYSRVAPNRFHFKSGKTRGKRKAARDKGGRRYGFDTH